MSLISFDLHYSCAKTTAFDRDRAGSGLEIVAKNSREQQSVKGGKVEGFTEKQFTRLDLKDDHAFIGLQMLI